jgi:hypothetical protein
VSLRRVLWVGFIAMDDVGGVPESVGDAGSAGGGMAIASSGSCSRSCWDRASTVGKIHEPIFMKIKRK